MLSVLLFLATGSAAQDAVPSPPSAPSSETAQREAGDAADIVVSGERGDPFDAANRRPKVILGSRIPRESAQNSPYIASATSLGGLTATSGMDPFKNDRTLRWTSCKVPGFAVSSELGCALGRARKAIDARDWAGARSILAELRARPQLSPDAHYLINRLSWDLASGASDKGGQRQALAGLVESGVLGESEHRAALRSLAAMALTAGDNGDAIARYRAVVQRDPDDHRSRINLGALLRQAGDSGGAIAHFRDAIAIMRRTGMAVPQEVLAAAQ